MSEYKVALNTVAGIITNTWLFSLSEISELQFYVYKKQITVKKRRFFFLINL